MSSISGLDPLYENIINDLMVYESQSLLRMEKERDSVNLLRSAYSDLDTILGDLQSQARSLVSTNAFYDFTVGRTPQVTNAPADTTVLSASVDSTSVPGQYDIDVTKLAEAEMLASAEQASIDQALGLSGTFWLGGHRNSISIRKQCDSR